jgi:hypothetical protein
VPVVFLIAALIILGAVVYVATGRGGELSAEPPDYAPLDLGPLSATDIVLHRPPVNMWGYSVQATDEALARIAESVRERDVRIVALEQLITDLSRDPAPALPPGVYVGHRRRDDDAEDAGDPQSGDLTHTLERPAAQPAQPALAQAEEPEEDLPHPVQWSRSDEPYLDAAQPDAAQPEAAQEGTAQEAPVQPQTSLELPWEPARAKPAPPAQPPQPAQPPEESQQHTQQQGPPERSHG